MYSRELSGFSPSQSILRSVGLFASFLSVAMTNIKSFTAIKDVCGTAHLLLLFLSIAISLSLQIVPFPTRSFVPGARRRKLFAPEDERAIAELRRRRRPFEEGGVAFKVFCAEQLLFLGVYFRSLKNMPPLRWDQSCHRLFNANTTANMTKVSIFFFLFFICCVCLLAVVPMSLKRLHAYMPVLSTCPLHTNSGCGKERHI